VLCRPPDSTGLRSSRSAHDLAPRFGVLSIATMRTLSPDPRSLFRRRPPYRGKLSPEGRAVIVAAAKARVAKQRKAVLRGELSRFPNGRPKKWLIPRWWRLKLSPEDEARVLAHMAAYDARVRGGEPRPPWQPSTSTTMEARSLESCERALILAMNRPDPPPLETVEQVYANVRVAEAIVGDAGSEIRFKRLAWEVDRFRRRRLEVSSEWIEEAKRHGEVRASNPSPREPAAARWPAPPDTFRDAVAPHDAMEQELAAELSELESLISALPLAESARASLDRELRYARDMEARAQVLRRWFASVQHASAASAALVDRYSARAETRAQAPRDDWRPSSIAPWLNKR
jgi:hypothetical protein